MKGEHATGRSAALRGAVHERLRPLRAGQRDLLLHAAAIGRTFDVTVLAALVGQTPARVRRVLRIACTLQLVERVDGSPSRFQFRHALTRDAMYGELVAAQLQPLHREIGLALERVTAGDRTTVDELAYHWWAAGDPERGSRYNEEAGDRAGALYAEDDALTYYHRALELLPGRSAASRQLEAKIDALRARAHVV